MTIKDTITVEKGEGKMLQARLPHGFKIHRIVKSQAEPDKEYVIISFDDLQAFAELFYSLGFSRGYNG